MKTAIVVMGVSGCGKSTIAALLAQRLGLPWAEADDLHSASNVAKMAFGTPLDDADRQPWLERIRDWIDEQPGDCVLTCSALRRRYRTVLSSGRAQLVYIHLVADPQLLQARLRGRQGHFMPPSLLQSQLETLEPLGDGETGLQIPATGSPRRITDEIVAWLQTGPGGLSISRTNQADALPTEADQHLG